MSTQDEHIAQFEAELAHDRDTHFAGFAEIVWDDLHTLYSYEVDAERYEVTDKQIITHFLYDFAVHVIRHTPFTPKHPPERYISECIPDLVERPERPDET